MSLKPLSSLSDYDLVNSEQDCRGREAVDLNGNRLGKVQEMIIDTERERVDSIMLDTGKHISVGDIALRDNMVLVRESGDVQAAQATETTTKNFAPPTATATAQSSFETAKSYETQTTVAPITAPVTMRENQQMPPQIMPNENIQPPSTARSTNQVTAPDEQLRFSDKQASANRQTVDLAIDVSAFAPFQDGVIELVETRDEPVISKQTRVIEEVILNKQVTSRNETIRDTVRRTDVQLERLDAPDNQN